MALYRHNCTDNSPSVISRPPPVMSPGVLQELPSLLPRGRKVVPAPGQHGHRGQDWLQGTQWTAGVQGKRWAAVVSRCHCGTTRERKDNLPSSSSWIRPVCHPSRQEVGGESSQVQARCNDCWRNRFGFQFLNLTLACVAVQWVDGTLQKAQKFAFFII